MARIAWIGLLAVAAAMPVDAVEGDARILGASPGCVERRLGVVSVELGSKEVDMRSGMPAPRASYQAAFRRLAERAAAKGADAVVLRGHEAGFVAKGSRRSVRPSFVSLRGAAIKLRDGGDSCALAVVDPVQFERDAIEKQRQDVRKDAGVSF